jgi:hypothetical protein
MKSMLCIDVELLEFDIAVPSLWCHMEAVLQLSELQLKTCDLFYYL